MGVDRTRRLPRGRTLSTV